MVTHFYIPSCSKAIIDDESVDSPVIIAAGAKATLLTDVSSGNSPYQYVRTWVQNVGGSSVNVALGNTADSAAYDLVLPANGMPFELTPFLGIVTAYSASGTTVCAVRLRTLENDPAQGGIIRPQGAPSIGY